MADGNQQAQGQTDNTGTGGGAGGKWYDDLPDDLKGNQAITGHSDKASLAKEYLDLKGKAITVPEKPEAYKVEAPTFLEAESGKAFVKDVTEIAHAAGLSQDQASRLAKEISQRQENQRNDLKAKIEQVQIDTVESLKKEWGDQYEETIKAVSLRTKQLGGDEFKQFLEVSGLGDNLNMIRFMKKVTDLISPDKFVDNDKTGSSQGQRTIAEKIYDGK